MMRFAVTSAVVSGTLSVFGLSILGFGMLGSLLALAAGAAVLGVLSARENRSAPRRARHRREPDVWADVSPFTATRGALRGVRGAHR